MKLYEQFPNRIEVGGRLYPLTLYFDRVLRFLDLLESEDYSPEEITQAGFAWLTDCGKNPPIEVQSEVLNRLISEIIAPPKRRISGGEKLQKAVDFSYDAAEIYASFMRDYHIDLEKEQGKMHWCAFIALFNGLSEDSPIKRIMKIRTEKIPPPNRHNAKQIQRLTELKTLYALPVKSGDNSGGDGWGGLFDLLLKKAEKEVR